MQYYFYNYFFLNFNILSRLRCFAEIVSGWGGGGPTECGKAVFVTERGHPNHGDRDEEEPEEDAVHHFRQPLPVFAEVLFFFRFRFINC